MIASFRRHLPAMCLLLILLLILFCRSFDPSLTLSNGDADLSVIRNHYRMLSTILTGPWVATSGMGNGGAPLNLAPGFLLAWLVPFYKYVDVNAVFHMLLMGIAGYFFIHDCTRNRFAATAGGVFLMLQPHVLSHLQPGHVGHFIMAGWVPAAFLFTRRALVQGGLANWVLAGACLGLMLAAGQHDVSAFFGLTLAAYGLFLLVVTRRNRTTAGQWLSVVGGVIMVAVLAILFAAQVVFANLPAVFRSHTKATTLETSQVEKMGEKDKWFWATQWSVPPVEMLDMAVPGFFGWGSSDPANPYRGRIGQTEGWMQHHQGMPNLNDVCQYLGAITLLAILVALVLRRRDPEVWFFAGIGLVALFLSFGKFGPLYRFFYALPGMDVLRNPIKWFYVTSLSAGILGGLGLAEACRKDRPAIPAIRAAILSFLPGLAVAGIAGLTLVRMETSTFIFWQQEVLVKKSAQSIGIACLFWSLGGVALFLLLTHRPNRPMLRLSALSLAILILASELIFIDSHYMPYQPWESRMNAGPFSEFLMSAQTPCRFRYLRQDGLFEFLRSVATMEGMENADPFASRLPDEYLLLQREMEAKDPVKFWRLCNVRYIVAPGPLQGPAFKQVLSLQAGKGNIVVSELKSTLPRCFWVSEWLATPERRASTLMADPGFDPGRKALIHANPQDIPPPPVPPDSSSTCRITSYSWNRLLAETTSAKPGLVMFLTRFDPDWHARVDGAPVPIWKANGIMQACPVPAGSHVVEFSYVQATGRPALHATMIGWGLAFILAACGLLIPRLRPGQESA